MSAILTSYEPATGETLWTGPIGDADAAVTAAREAWPGWAAKSFAFRVETLRRFANLARAQAEPLATAIAREVGKPLWEARTEVAAWSARSSSRSGPCRAHRCHRKCAMGATSLRHKPHGVVAVFGPYNFPGHLPNGHIVPALLAGNTVVFKQRTDPLVAEEPCACGRQGCRPASQPAARRTRDRRGRSRAPGLDGLFFTALAPARRTGVRRQPEKILALEMGGNNPLIVGRCADRRAAVHESIQSAYLTSGQRCTCARAAGRQAAAATATACSTCCASARKIRGRPLRRAAAAVHGPGGFGSRRRGLAGGAEQP